MTRLPDEPLPSVTRRAALAGLLMVGASALGTAMIPTRRMADRRGPFRLADAIPLRFRGWEVDARARGIVVNPQTEALLKRLYTETLERTYVRGPGERIMLSIAYGADQSDVSLQMHYPEVCYPAQGFQLNERREDVLDLPMGRLPVRRLETVFSTTRHEPVTYWTVIGDELTMSSMDKRLAEIRHGLRGEIVDGMLVRVSSISPRTEDAFALQDQFIRDMLLSLTTADRRRLAALP
ncbi:exosortase-associated protein EpsI, B-type [Ideonella sp. DXS29W]|uniref:Exosortase-associated protein EpsI, B-type n=1 Tax=Ideonella lacteola TaxID=2984193 RepID=A0ABU9BLF3_9BURK